MRLDPFCYCPYYYYYLLLFSQLPQPKDEEMYRLAPSNKYEGTNTSTSHPVAAHALESISSRSVTSQKNSKPSAENQSTDDSFVDSVASYFSNPPPKTTKSVVKTSGSIFSLLEQKKVEVEPQEFNYSTSPPAPPLPDYTSIKKKSKHKRIKLVPKTEIPSEGGVNAPGHVLKPLNLEASVSSSNSKSSGQGELCYPTVLEADAEKKAKEKEEEKKRKLKAVGVYIMEVRT